MKDTKPVLWFGLFPYLWKALSTFAYSRTLEAVSLWTLIHIFIVKVKSFSLFSCLKGIHLIEEVPKEIHPAIFQIRSKKKKKATKINQSTLPPISLVVVLKTAFALRARKGSIKNSEMQIILRQYWGGGSGGGKEVQENVNSGLC